MIQLAATLIVICILGRILLFCIFLIAEWLGL
jgi:hypothetical protein